VRILWIDCASLVLALCLIEFPALINVVNYKSLIEVTASSDSDVSDPELIHRHSAYWHFTGAFKGGNISDGVDIPPADLTFHRWDVRYDRNGFRNERDLSKADVAVLGDSFIESLFRPTPQLLTSFLSSRQGNVVANLGQFGYGPMEELAVLKRYALPLRPQTVVWTFYEGNDLGDLVHYHSVIGTRPTEASGGKPKAEDDWAAFKERSFTLNSLVELRKLRHPQKPPGVRILGIVHTPDGRETNMYFSYKAGPLPEAYQMALDETIHILQTASELCAAQGARLLVVLIPEKFRVFQPFCRFPKESECRNWTLNDLPDQLERGIRSSVREARYLDLTPVFRDLTTRGTLPFERDDTHWSAAGEQAAAEAINNQLRNWQPQGTAGTRGAKQPNR
jgi:hypothetical protein